MLTATTSMTLITARQRYSILFGDRTGLGRVYDLYAWTVWKL